jgi:Dehydrogenases with different specificities (related to short-chain alcohol dehydrogenases)
MRRHRRSEKRRRDGRRCGKRFGRIDVLVNGAAGRTPGFFKPFEEYELSDWNAVVAANLTGTFLCCQAVGPQMKKGGGGSIINTSSIYGVVAPDQRIYDGSSINTPAVYSASKAGVIGLTRYLATYWAEDKIRVNTITPGGMFNEQEPEFVRRYESRTPLGRMGRPHELRGAIVFLASEMSSYVTGHNLVVDGGWTTW